MQVPYSIVVCRLHPAISGVPSRRTPMDFRDYYHHHPHGAPIGGLVVVLLIVVIVVLLTRDSKG